MKNREWYQLSSNEVIENFSSSIDGLSNEESKKRLKKYGLNILPKKKCDGLIKTFFNEFKDPILVILLVASVFSFLVGEVIDGIAILFIMLVDVIVGTIEEYKANKSAEALQELIKVEATVIRDNKEIRIDSSEIVIGDILLLEAGNKISIDGRIIESTNLTVNESVLTGESINAIKDTKIIKDEVSIVDRINMVYAGTCVITGRAKVIVTSTSMNTEIGKIATEVNSIKEELSPLTIRMNKFSKQISVLILFLAIIIMFVLKYKGYPNTEIFLSVIALSVSAMPEGLPLALTMALTIGSDRMLKKNVLVKKLNAAESLGSCTVIASDKTGTLTVNEQTAKKIVLPDNSTYEITGSGYNNKGNIEPLNKAKMTYKDLIIKSGLLNNEARLEEVNNKWIGVGDSIDIAFLSLGLKNRKEYKVNTLEQIPYESENKYSALYYEEKSILYCTAKGSVEVILDFCDTMICKDKTVKLDKKKILEQNESLAMDGYRVIALASREVKSVSKKIPKLSFLGLVAFIDPVRKNVVKSIRECKRAGIKVVMITGDHPLTSFYISKEIGIAKYFNDVATSKEIDEEILKGEESFDNFVRNKTVFSRVTPIQKLKIVESYKRQGEFVAVTGDGVNDAPAIKSANIGISMGSGTDVAKETSNMIILDDNFNSIVGGIKEGRVAYNNIRKITYLLISCGIAEVLFFLLSIIFDMPMPLVAIQLLWLNLVTDGFQDLALSFEKGEDNDMLEKPRNTKESLFDKSLIIEILISGLLIGILVFLVWSYLINIANMETTLARGYILALMVFIQNVHVLNCRSEKTSAFDVPLLKNPFIIFSICGSIILQVLVMEVPILSEFLQTHSICVEHLILMFIFALPIFIVMEIYKYIRYYRKK